ncbi:MAG: hypothetical protein WAP35_01685 [Solirubrobacterales bacterium]
MTGWKDLTPAQKANYEGEVLPYLLELDQEDASSVSIMLTAATR